MQNINSFKFQQQQQQQQQNNHLQINSISNSSAIDYSINRNNENNASQTNDEYQYQQKKFNYKTKLNQKATTETNQASNSSNFFLNNNKRDLKDDTKDDTPNEQTESNHLDSSFSNFSSFSTDTYSYAKNVNKKQKQQLLSNPSAQMVKQEKPEEFNASSNNSRKRRESFPDTTNTIYDNDEDDHNSEMNDDDDDFNNQMNDSKDKKPKSDLNCVVCDSPANGYNFDAVTCESCKAFFRRNAFRPINLFRCSNNDSCVITVATRKKCKKCRIAKCFRLGMRRDWIMTEVEREEKRKKIEENRRRKQTTVNTSNSNTNDADMMPSSNLSNQYDEYSQQYDSNSMPVRRRRRRRRNSWFDKNKSESVTTTQNHSIQPQQKQQSSDICQAQFTVANKPIIHNNNNNKTKQSSFNHQTSQEKQNSPLSCSLSSTTSSSSSSSSLFTNNRNSQFDPSNPILGHNNNNNSLPLNLVTKQNLDNGHLISNKLTSINQFIESNKNSSISSQFLLSPTVQQQLQLTFEQQQRLLQNKLPILDYNKSPFNPLQTKSSLATFTSAFSPAFNNTTTSTINTTSNNNNDDNNGVLIDTDKKLYNELRRRRKLKESDYLIKEPITNHDAGVSLITSTTTSTTISTKNELENKLEQLQYEQNAATPLLPALKYLTKNNIDNLNEIKLDTMNDLVRSNRILSPVSSNCSSSSSSSSSCDQYQYDENNLTTIKMSDLQRKQVEAVTQAYKQAIQLVKAQGLPKNSQDINTTINLTELAVRRIIFYFKLISDFRDLKHDLMVVLLKFNMMSLLQIHGINSYNREENTFKEPDTDDTPFSAQSIESVYGASVYELSISITRNLFDLCAGDMTHIKILMLIVLFDPYNEKLNETEKANVAKLQNKYVTLLHAYLCEIMGSPRAEHTFKSILVEISKINDLGKWFEKTVAEKSSCDFVRPLMKEVFGIATPANSAASTPIISSHPSSIDSSCSVKSNKICLINHNNDSANYDTPATCSTSVSENSFYNNNNNNNNINNINNNNNSKFISSSPNNK